jgi:hypothetical protein
MSRDFILNYAKGDSTEPSYLVVYSETECDIVIHSCVIIENEKSVLIRKAYERKERIASEKEVLQAATRYMAAGKEDV